MPKVLTQTQIESFHENGFLFPVRVFSQTEADAVRARFEQFCLRFPEHAAKLDVKANIICPWVTDLCRSSRILDVIEDLIGLNILCTSSNFRHKPPDGRTHAGWHQDGKYIQMEPDLTLMVVALTDFTEQSGCVQFIPGSHRWGYLEHSETDPDPDSILDRQQKIVDDFDESLAVPAILEPGEMSLHQPGMIHGSQPNRADFTRIAWIADYMPTHGRVLSGQKAGAMLMRGTDSYHHFEEETAPHVEASPAALAAWRRSVEMSAATIYAGSGMAPLAMRE